MLKNKFYPAFLAGDIRKIRWANVKENNKVFKNPCKSVAFALSACQ